MREVLAPGDSPQSPGHDDREEQKHRWTEDRDYQTGPTEVRPQTPPAVTDREHQKSHERDLDPASNRQYDQDKLQRIEVPQSRIGPSVPRQREVHQPGDGGDEGDRADR